MKVIKDGDLIQTESYSHYIYRQPDNRSQVFTEDAFGLTKYDGYTGPEGIFGFPEPEVSLQKGYWEKVSGRYSVARGHIKVPNDGEVEISGKLTLSKTPGGIEGEIGLWVGQEEEVNQKNPTKIFNAKKNTKLIRTDLVSQEYGHSFYEIHANVNVKAGDKILFKNLKSFSKLSSVKIWFNPKDDKKERYYYEIGPDETFILVEASNAFALHLPKDPYARQGLS